MPEITIMSFNVKRNIFNFGPKSWSSRCALVARSIAALDPDIVGTQELTSAGLGDLQRLLPEYEHVGQGRGGGDKGEYTAIFYKRDRFQLVASETFWLSATPLRPSRDRTTPFQRTCTWCELVHNENPGRSLRVYNTHLDHLSYFARVHGLRIICREILERLDTSPSPVVLMGDFNASPNSRTLKAWARENLKDSAAYLLNSYNAVERSPVETHWGRSYHGFGGKEAGQPIDYIFTTKDLVLRKVDICRDRVDDRFPSDHYPVVARIEF